MYLAQFEDGGGSWVQGLVELRGRRLASSVGDESALLGALARALDALGPLGASMRVVVSERGETSVALSAVVPRQSDALLRRWLAGFLRFEARARDVARLPLTRAEHDEVRRAFPPLRCRVAAPAYTARGHWLGCRLGFFAALDELVHEARALHLGFGYQVNLRPLGASTALLRAAKRNLLGLTGVAGVPAAVVALQRELVDRLPGVVALAEETVAVDDAEGQYWLARRLADRFVALQGIGGLEPPPFEFVADGFEDGIELGLHRSVLDEAEVDAAEMLSTGVDRDAYAHMLSWAPRHDERAAADEVDAQGADAAAPADLPPPAAAGEFAFISYRRGDAPHIAPALRFLAERGLPFWHDRGIVGGSEWDAVIEDRIEHCRALVVFLSRDAVASKWVRREVKFADALDKPIIAVLMEAVALDDGLRMLLSQYQVVSGAPAERDARLAQALTSVWS